MLPEIWPNDNFKICVIFHKQIVDEDLHLNCTIKTNFALYHIRVNEGRDEERAAI